MGVTVTTNTNLTIYTEELHFRVFERDGNAGSAEDKDNNWVLLPSDFDLALKHIEVESYETAMDRLNTEDIPSEVHAAQEAIMAAEGRHYDRYLATIKGWEDTRIRERRTIHNSLHVAKFELGKLEEVAADEAGGILGGRHVIERYRMREFSRAERAAAEDEFSPLDPETNERKLNFEARNEWLLGLVVMAKDGVPYERDENGRMDIGDLQDRRVGVLIERMWARNQMNPAFGPFFRNRRGAASDNNGKAGLELRHSISSEGRPLDTELVLR